MTVAKNWVPDRRDIIWIDCNPQAGREMKDMHLMLVLSNKMFNERTSIVIGLPMSTSPSNDSNPFAVKYMGTRGVVGYVLTHQPKSFDWRVRGAKPHPWKQVIPSIFAASCEMLNEIILIGN
jgi:mRNA interferase MazF